MEKRPYHIYVHMDGGVKKSPVAGEEDAASYGGNQNSSDSAGGNNATADNFVSAAKKLVGYHALFGTVDRVLNYQVSQVNLTTGAAEYQQRLQTQYSIGKQMVDSAVTLGIGISTGTWPLALAALTMKGFSQVLGYFERARTLQNEQRLENIQLGMMTTRAGVTGRRSTRQ